MVSQSAYAGARLAGIAPGWQRLGASLSASLALHAALVAALVLLPPLASPKRPVDAPLVVRLASAAPPVPAAALAPAPRPPAAARAMAAPSHPPAARRSAPPVPLTAPPSRLGRTGYATAQVEMLDEALAAEKLDEAQRKVPRAGDFARPAKPLDAIRPAYPAQALARGERGSVLLEVFVGPGGAIEQIVTIDDGGAPHFAAAAEEAVRRARFRPAAGSGGTSRSRVTLRFSFIYE